jgi:arylsulfatase A-like enzyme
VDAQLGTLFEFLRARGEWDRTFVVFTADHGEQLGDHWLLSKTGFFDSSYHLPFIVRDPRPACDAGRGGTVAQYTEAVDALPTICEAFGLPVPAQCDGRSLTPFLAGGASHRPWSH